MYKSQRKLLLTILLIVTSIIDVVSQAKKVKELDQGYYVVIGAFKIQENAKHFSEMISQKGMAVSHGFDGEKEMHYVSVGKFSALDTAIQEVMRVRTDTIFHDAWIKSIGHELDTQNQTLLLTNTSALVESTTDLEPANEEKIIQYDHTTLENTEVFLSLFNATNNSVVEGKVKIIDPTKNKLVTEVNGNQYLMLPSSLKGSEKLILLCEIIGYRKIQLAINYANPFQEKGNPSIELFGTTIFVNFEMVPYVKGDIITLYNVYFYNDASIMQSESQYELNQVVQMMKDNPNRRIRLHGHTNGNYAGKIISIGPDKNYFSLSSGVNHVGTARELAEERAMIIRQYLVDNDIDKNRIEMKAWGGKRPLFDKHSARAKLNVRVEVEVL